MAVLGNMAIDRFDRRDDRPLGGSDPRFCINGGGGDSERYRCWSDHWSSNDPDRGPVGDSRIILKPFPGE